MEKTTLELAADLLRLEQQLEAYKTLHEEELAKLSQDLNNIRQQLLALLASREPTRSDTLTTNDSAEESTAMRYTLQRPSHDS